MSEKMQPMTREQLVGRVAYFRDRCYHWHQVAKKWRKKFHDLTNEIVLAYEDKQNAEALVASQLKLLRESEEAIKELLPVVQYILEKGWDEAPPLFGTKFDETKANILGINILAKLAKELGG